MRHAPFEKVPGNFPTTFGEDSGWLLHSEKSLHAKKVSIARAGERDGDLAATGATYGRTYVEKRQKHSGFA
jgi:hypothetical protein